MPKTVKIGTWNVGSLYTDPDRTFPYVEELLGQQKLDILCMQELPEEEPLLERIAQWGNFPHRIFHVTSVSHVHEGHNMGIAIFSRFPLTVTDTIRLTKPTVPIFYNGKQEYWHDKYFLAASCTVGTQRITVVTGHGFPFHRYDLEKPENYHIIRPSFRELDRWMTRLPGGMFCAAADFNLHDALPFLPEISQTYGDVYYNEPTRPSGRKTDGILIGQQTACVEKTNIVPPRRRDGRGILDHNFIAATVQL